MLSPTQRARHILDYSVVESATMWTPAAQACFLKEARKFLNILDAEEGVRGASNSAWSFKKC